MTQPSSNYFDTDLYYLSTSLNSSIYFEDTSAVNKSVDQNEIIRVTGGQVQLIHINIMSPVCTIHKIGLNAMGPVSIGNFNYIKYFKRLLSLNKFYYYFASFKKNIYK